MAACLGAAIALVIIAPSWLARAGLSLPLPPLHAAIAVAFVCIFGPGAFLGRVGGTYWLWSGVKALLIGLATVLLMRLFEG